VTSLRAAPPVVGGGAAVRADRGAGLDSAWGMFWRSRLLIWTVGCAAALVFGTASSAAGAFDPTGITSSFGRLGNLLTAPAVRWDSIWYLQIAEHGYRHVQQAFFPLYPLLVRLFSPLTGSAAVAGILISNVALLVGLGLVLRLTELELGKREARLAVALLAFTPVAVFFSAGYTESLFLALSAGMFLAARRERWASAGLLGGLAVLTHPTGLLLVVPFAVLFFYGPRRAGLPGGSSGRYPFSAAALWSGLIPGALALYSGYLALAGFSPGSFLHAEQVYWGRELVGPLGGILTAVRAALSPITTGHGAAYDVQAWVGLLTLGIAVVALRLTASRLPAAYGAYAAVALVLTMSSTTRGTGLVSLDRYAGVLFPLYMGLAAWLARRGRAWSATVFLGAGVLLIVAVVEFATWRFAG
jgi:hypothetical protein